MQDKPLPFTASVLNNIKMGTCLNTFLESLVAVWSEASQHHEICHDPEVMGLNPAQVELGGMKSFCLRYYNINGC